jgi:hypothetical protein
VCGLWTAVRPFSDPSSCTAVQQDARERSWNCQSSPWYRYGYVVIIYNYIHTKLMNKFARWWTKLIVFILFFNFGTDTWIKIPHGLPTQLILISTSALAEWRATSAFHSPTQRDTGLPCLWANPLHLVHINKPDACAVLKAQHAQDAAMIGIRRHPLVLEEKAVYAKLDSRTLTAPKASSVFLVRPPETLTTWHLIQPWVDKLSC